MIRSSYRLQRAESEPVFLFCHWLQAVLAAALLAALWMMRTLHPEWIQILLQALSERTFEISDFFQMFENIP